MLPKELDHEDGELTATQKVRRSAVADAVRRPGRRHLRRGSTHDRLSAEGGAARASGVGSVYALLALGLRHHLQGDPGDQLRPAGPDARRRRAGQPPGRPARLLGRAAAGRAAAPPCSALGVERGAVRPMVGRPAFVVAIITLGVDVAIRVVVNVFIGLDVRNVARPVGPGELADRLGARCEQRHVAAFLATARAGRRAVRVLPVHPDGPGDAGGRRRPGSRAGAGRLGRRGVRAVAGRWPARWPRSAARSPPPAAASTAHLWLIALVALPVIILGGLDSLPGAVIGGLARRRGAGARRPPTRTTCPGWAATSRSSRRTC